MEEPPTISFKKATSVSNTDAEGTVCPCSVMPIYCKVAGEKYHVSGTAVIELAAGNTIQIVLTSDAAGDNVTLSNFTTTIGRFYR